MTPRRETARTGLRKVEEHCSWREVYAALEVDPNHQKREVAGNDW